MGLFDFFRKKSPPTISQAQLQTVQATMTQMQDSVKLVNTTTNPSVFFGRLNFTLDLLLRLKPYEQYKIFNSSTPTQDYNKIINNLESTVDNFIDRALDANKQKIASLKTEKARERNNDNFTSALIAAFDCAHTFWEGNRGFPHYDGPLYTDANYHRVKCLFDSLSAESATPVIPQSSTKAFNSSHSPVSKKLTYAEKERICVNRVTIQDMQQFTAMPFHWNSDIHKYIQPNSHPFAYINLDTSNVKIAISELERMNKQLNYDVAQTTVLPRNLQIPTHDIVFAPSHESGYTRLICTPYTFEGQISEHPLSLSFMTELNHNTNTTHGDLFYGADGCIRKANIYFWRRNKGHFFYYDTVDCELVLSRVEVPDMQGGKNTIYKGKHILEWEAKRAQEEKDYSWLQEQFPEKCPKSVTGYRRMKTQNTKNYQILKQMAAELGRDI